MIYNIAVYSGIGFSNWTGAFIHGIQLDLSITAYILMLLSLLLSVGSLFKANFTILFIKYLNLVLLFMFSWIVVADLELYRNWGYRMDVSVFAFLKTPDEAAASTSAGTYILLILIFIVLFYSFFRLFSKWIFVQERGDRQDSVRHSLAFVFIAALMIIPVRGGFGLAPINAGTVYFSKNSYANHAALNVIWTFNQSVLYSMDNKNIDLEPVTDLDMEVYSHLYPEDTTSVLKVLNTPRPNILIIILESFSSNVVQAFGGESGVAPNLSRIAGEGLRFVSFYAAGTRSCEGLGAIIAGSPSTERRAIIHDSRRNERLPSIVRAFSNEAYSSAFYYGGDLDFGNMRSFIYSMGFEKSMSELDFERHDRNSKWGIHDHILLDSLLKDLDRVKRPFFNVAFTLSSHEPFVVPHKSEYQGTNLGDKFRNSVSYTDKYLGWFIDEARERDWWDSTLVILIADHGSRLPGMLADHEKDRFRIPMVWTGGALTVRDTTIYKIGSQTDLAASLLAQTGLDHSSFTFSNDLFSDSPGFAFYNFNNGYGYLDESSCLVVDKLAGKVLEGYGDRKQAEEKAGALFRMTKSYYYSDN